MEIKSINFNTQDYLECLDLSKNFMDATKESYREIEIKTKFSLLKIEPNVQLDKESF